jgi:hypothetical protein
MGADANQIWHIEKFLRLPRSQSQGVNRRERIFLQQVSLQPARNFGIEAEVH